MSICMFAVAMNLPIGSGISEEQLGESAPLVRALAVQRYEMIWRACQPHIDIPAEHVDQGRKPDPRFVEAGIRVTDRLVALYQLLKPQHQMAEPEAVSRQDQRDLVRGKLLELEQKVQNRVS